MYYFVVPRPTLPIFKLLDVWWKNYLVSDKKKMPKGLFSCGGSNIVSYIYIVIILSGQAEAFFSSCAFTCRSLICCVVIYTSPSSPTKSQKKKEWISSLISDTLCVPALSTLAAAKYWTLCNSCSMSRQSWAVGKSSLGVLMPSHLPRTDSFWDVLR